MSEASYELSTEGVDQAAALLARFPEISIDETRNAMTRSVMQLASDVKAFTPVYMGLLRSKVGSQVDVIGQGVTPQVRGIVHSGGVPYALPVELGRRPGSWPPLEPLRRWCYLVLGDAELAYQVARKIFQRGIEPRAMFAQAWRKDKEWINQQFTRARDRIVQRLADIGIKVSFE